MSALGATSAFGQPVADVCAALGRAQRWFAVADGSLKVRAFPIRDGSYTTWASQYMGNVCAGKAQIQSAWVDGDAVVTANKGGGLAIKRAPYYADQFSCNYAVTDGAAISGIQYAYFQGTDTTGRHPIVDICAQAKLDAKVASSDFSSRTPTHVFGNVVVRAGEVFTMDLRGGGDALVRVNSLVLYPTRSAERLPNCRGFGHADEAWIDVLADPGAAIVINVVGSLRLSDCSGIRWPGNGWDENPLVLNMPGPGPSVTLGKGGDPSLIILAPFRKISAQGLNGYAKTFWGGLFGQSVQYSGGGWLYPVCGDSLPQCHDGVHSAGYNEWCDDGDDAACPGQCTECQCVYSPNVSCETATVVTTFPFAEHRDGTKAWYQFTAPSNGRLTATNQGGAYNSTAIELLEGACPDPVSLATAYGDAGAFGTLTADVVGGQAYWVTLDTGTTSNLGVTLAFTPS